MVRSFDYAAWTALRRHWELLPPDGNTVARERDARGAEIWGGWLGREFVRAYIPRLGEIRIDLLPRDVHDTELVLRSWALEKSLYEVRYELNSRPQWVDIPLRAVNRILAKGGGNEAAVMGATASGPKSEFPAANSHDGKEPTP
jgi:maltose alpha-D-glucosyltransferase/alpha-amylase